MTNFNKVASILFTDKPITLLFDKNTYLTDQEINERKKRVNPIFEIFNGDCNFYPDWQMCYPKMVAYQNVDYHAMLRTILGRGDAESMKSLGQLSILVNTLRSKITTKKANEDEYLLYLKVIGMIGETAKNNQWSFSYEIPVDDDGKNPVRTSGVETIVSDEYDFEYIQVLLSLLSFYNHHMISEIIPKVRIEYSKKCVTIIQAIYHKCSSIVDGNEKRVKAIYKKSPSSISSLDKRDNEDANQGDQLDILLFIDYYLGGLSSIRARLHLFRAKQYELFYMIQSQAHNEYLDSLTDIMGSVIEAYDLSYKAASEHNANSKLTGYTRFMAHLWSCETNYFIATSLARDDDIEQKTEALQRGLYIQSIYTEYRKNVKTTFLIGDKLKERYSKVILGSTELIRELYQALSPLMSTTGIEKAFTIPTQKGLEKESQQYETLLNSVYELSMKSTSIGNALDRFILLIHLSLKTSDGGKNNHNNDKEGRGEQVIVNSTVTIPTTTRLTLFDEIDDVESAKIGMLKERMNWLSHLLGQYSVRDNAFIIDPQNYNKYTKELEDVYITMKKHSDQYK